MYWRAIIITAMLVLIIFSSCNIKGYERDSSRTIRVEVKGEVEKPGVYEMDLGSTYEDLFKECGVSEDADLSSLALQKVLSDKQMIVIPGQKEEQLISINSARLEELVTLPGIGEKTAAKIIEYREENGGFRSLEELLNVKGIGQNKFARIREYITL